MTMPNESQPMGGVQSSPAYQNRGDAFAEGHQMSGPTVSPGLAADQQSMNQGPARVRPSGSVNGISADQSAATMGGSLQNSNGQSSSSWENKKWFEPRNQ